VRKSKGKHHLKKLGIDGRIIMRWALRKWIIKAWTNYSCSELGQVANFCVNAVINLRVLYKAGVTCLAERYSLFKKDGVVRTPAGYAIVSYMHTNACTYVHTYIRRHIYKLHAWRHTYTHTRTYIREVMHAYIHTYVGYIHANCMTRPQLISNYLSPKIKNKVACLA
jgi:hypothetical protein